MRADHPLNAGELIFFVYNGFLRSMNDLLLVFFFVGSIHEVDSTTAKSEKRFFLSVNTASNRCI